jgi:hypothetical protein
MPHLAQRMEIPSLSILIKNKPEFGLSFITEDPNDESVVVAEENDFDVRVIAEYGSGQRVTLYRSAHSPLERDIINGEFLRNRATQIEREAILGLYPRSAELASAEHLERRRIAC